MMDELQYTQGLIGLLVLINAVILYKVHTISNKLDRAAEKDKNKKG